MADCVVILKKYRVRKKTFQFSQVF